MSRIAGEVELEITYHNSWQAEILEEYAMRIVWYGRKAARTMCSGGETQIIQFSQYRTVTFFGFLRGASLQGFLIWIERPARRLC